MRKIKFLLWVVVCCLFISGNAATVLAEEAGTYTSEESYTTRSLLDLYKTNDLNFINDDQNIAIVEKSDGILISGSSSTLTSGTFQINKTFHFDGNRVGRLAFDGLAGKDQDLTVKFYLDNNTESFASITLPKQGRADSWTRDISLQTDVLSQNITGDHTVSFTIEAAEGTESISALLRSIEFVENSVPTVYMNLDESLGSIADMNNSETKVDECYGSMQIEIPEGYTYEYGENAGKSALNDSTEEYELSYLRGRGNSTWNIDKKPYKLKLAKSAELLGMGSNKHWALIANRYDNSKLRNKMTYWLGDQIGLEYSPNLVPVDVVMNGIYFGSYYLCETIRVDQNRLNIDDLTESEDTMTSTDPEIISGGYLLNFAGWGDDADTKSFTTTRGLSFSYNSPSYQDYENETQMNYIKDYMQKTEDALYGDNFQDEDGVSYTEYMDLDSAVDYFWFQELSSNGDGYGTASTYLYKKRDGKLYWGPIWDFDYVAWNGNEFYSSPEDLSIIDSFEEGSVLWIERLYQDPAFKKRMAERWPIIKEKLLAYCEDGGVMDQYYDLIETSLRYDVEKWGFVIYDDEEDDDAIHTVYNEKETLKNWVVRRVNWFDTHIIDKYRADNYKITFKADGKNVAVLDAYSGYALDSFPTAPSKSGYLFEGWVLCDSEGNATETYVDDGTIFTEDTTLQAVYVSAEHLTAPEALYISRSEIYTTASLEWEPDSEEDAEDNPNELQIYATVYPANAYGTIKYSSSDKNVATIDQTGLITFTGRGTTKIVVTCGSLKKTCKLFVTESGYGDSPEEGNVSLSPSKVSLNIGQRKQLALTFDVDNPAFTPYSWISLDDSIASVDICGVITAKKAGTTSILLYDDQTCTTVRKCTVTVTDPSKSIKKGYVYTYKGLKYKVTSKASKGGNVTILGPTSKKIKTVNIRTTLKIKGETYKVTGISSKAFYKCKKLRKITMGSNIKSIGSKAFTGIYKKAVFKVPASKKKAYKKLLTKSKGFKKTMKITK